jgi:hypothetical protein
MKKLSILFVLLIAISFTSCLRDVFCIEGKGDIVTVELELDDFNAINAIGVFDIFITQGSTQHVEIKGEENIIDHLETNVTGNIWDIQLDDDHCYTDYNLTLYIEVPDIEEITITGSSDVYIEDFTEQESLELNIIGSGDVEINEFLGCENLEIKISGTGDIDCKGQFDNLKQLDIDVTGSGDFDGFYAITDYCNINISGSGDCEVYVLKELDVNISGTGNIYYKGNPSITTNISGLGDIYNEN